MTEVRYRVVRIWELDAARVMEQGDSTLLPLAGLMNSTDEQVREIGNRVALDREAAGQFLALLAIRYDRDQIEKILGENPMFTKAIIKESWAVQEVMEDSRIEGEKKGRAEGEKKGLAEGEKRGRTEEARTLLARSLASRFPSLETLPELDAIQDATVLENLLLEHIIGGSDRQTSLDAIRHAASK